MKRQFLIVIMGCLFFASAALSEPLKKIPALNLTPLQGEALTEAQLVLEGKWLLINLSGDDKGDRILLAMMQGLEDYNPGNRVTIVVAGATPEKLGGMIKRNDKLATFRWLADSDRSAAKALQLSGTAIIMGMSGSDIQWVVGGTGKDKKILRSQLADWLK